MPRQALYRTATIAAVASAAAVALWIGLAWRTPSSTYHFAPLIAAGVGPYVARASAGRIALRDASVVVAASLVVAVVATAVLDASDKLQGPTFWSEDGAVIENLIFAVLGGAVGLSMLSRRRSTAPAAN